MTTEPDPRYVDGRLMFRGSFLKVCSLYHFRHFVAPRPDAHDYNWIAPSPAVELEQATIRHAMAFLYRLDAKSDGNTQKSAMWARFEAAELATINRLS